MRDRELVDRAGQLNHDLPWGDLEVGHHLVERRDVAVPGLPVLDPPGLTTLTPYPGWRSEPGHVVAEPVSLTQRGSDPSPRGCSPSGRESPCR